MEPRPPSKPFWMVPFAAHAARGLVRDQGARRKMMTIFLVLALALVVAGLTVLRSWLDPHQHQWRFVLYWLVCGWQIVLVFLLALLDLLVVRAQARGARKALRKKIAGDPLETGMED